MERVVDINIEIDGICLKDGETIDEVISKIEKIVDSIYPIKWEIIQEEFYED